MKIGILNSEVKLKIPRLHLTAFVLGCEAQSHRDCFKDRLLRKIAVLGSRYAAFL
jgi:hypothetical protein